MNYFIFLNNWKYNMQQYGTSATSCRIFTLFAHNLAKVGHINRLEWAMEQGIAKNIGGHPNKY
jgi:hypothetical protein